MLRASWLYTPKNRQRPLQRTPLLEGGLLRFVFIYTVYVGVLAPKSGPFGVLLNIPQTRTTSVTSYNYSVIAALSQVQLGQWYMLGNDFPFVLDASVLNLA